MLVYCAVRVAVEVGGAADAPDDSAVDAVALDVVAAHGVGVMGASDGSRECEVAAA